MIYTNYTQTPTPEPRPREFYQHTDNPLADALADHQRLPSWVMGTSTPTATMAKAGTILATKPFIRASQPPMTASTMGMRFDFVHDRNGAELRESHGFGGLAGTGRGSTTSADVDDADGAGWQANGTEASGSTVNGRSITFSAGQLQLRWGFYYWVHFKLPTAMTSLVNRIFHGGVASADFDAQSDDADTGGTTTASYICWRWRQDTDSQLVIRVGDGTNDSNSVGLGSVLATGTAYYIEIWKHPDDAMIKARVNNGAVAQVAMTYAPASGTSLNQFRSWRASNTGSAAGLGSIGFITYGTGLIAWS